MNKSLHYEIDLDLINEMAENYTQLCEHLERVDSGDFSNEYYTYLISDQALEDRDKIYDDLEEYLILCLRDFKGTHEEYDAKIRNGLRPYGAPVVWDLLSYLLGD